MFGKTRLRIPQHARCQQISCVLYSERIATVRCTVVAIAVEVKPDWYPSSASAELVRAMLMFTDTGSLVNLVFLWADLPKEKQFDEAMGAVGSERGKV